MLHSSRYSNQNHTRVKSVYAPQALSAQEYMVSSSSMALLTTVASPAYSTLEQSRTWIWSCTMIANDTKLVTLQKHLKDKKQDFNMLGVTIASHQQINGVCHDAVKPSMYHSCTSRHSHLSEKAPCCGHLHWAKPIIVCQYAIHPLIIHTLYVYGDSSIVDVL